MNKLQHAIDELEITCRNIVKHQQHRNEINGVLLNKLEETNNSLRDLMMEYDKTWAHDVDKKLIDYLGYKKCALTGCGTILSLGTPNFCPTHQAQITRSVGP